MRQFILFALLIYGQPVIMHGGNRYPTKYGLPLIEIWQNLGVNWHNFSLEKTQDIFNQTHLGFINHFPLTNTLWEYREQLGKRPPLATMELIWCPYAGDAEIIAGFVHPPTENMFQTALKMQGVKKATFIKGLEGSCDLPRDRTAIIGVFSSQTEKLERLLLAPRDYGFTNKNVPLETTAELIKNLQSILTGEPSELMQTALWNGGFYLWYCGICPDIQTGVETAREMFISGVVAAKLQELIRNS